jgi:hypothetical protein
MWVASFSDLPLSERQVLKMERVGSWRRLGKLEEGIHYLTIEEAKAANLPIHGVNQRGCQKQRFVYNTEALLNFFEDKTYTPRKPR